MSDPVEYEVIPPKAVEDEGIKREAELQTKIDEQAARIRALEGEVQTLWKGYQGAGGLAALLVLGSSLTRASRAFFGALGLGKSVPRKEAADLFAAVVRRVVLVGFVGIVVAGIPIWLMWEQNRLMESQNAAILRQIAETQKQVRLQTKATRNQEADTRIVRRTQLLTLIFERAECDLTEELKVWEKRMAAAEKAYDLFYELKPQCEPKAPLRVRQQAVLALAQLDGENLDLTRSSLSGANLSSANLTGATFYRANLEGAYLETNLTGATFYRANLLGASISGADLSGAELYMANLLNTDLSGAKLDGAYISHAPNLTQDQLDSAWGDHLTQISDELKRPEHWRMAGENDEVWLARIQMLDNVAVPWWLEEETP